jgi:hypothetical protein
LKKGVKFGDISKNSLGNTLAFWKKHLIPLHPPLSKGGNPSPLFVKGRLGGILQNYFIQLKCYKNRYFRKEVELIHSIGGEGA